MKMSYPMSENQSAETEKGKTIDDAIGACEKFIFWHRAFSALWLLLLAGCAVIFYFAFKGQEVSERNAAMFFSTSDIKELSTANSHQSHMMFAFIGLFIVTFGIITALYRFHLLEISRNEQMKLGYWRIRIAARNPEKGFQTEVRQALTKDAFSFDKTGKPDKDEKLESPVPGHPFSELTTAVLNKILEKIDIEVVKKPKD